MDWSKIKTIFILTFLVLDIYLMYEFFKLTDSSQYEYSTETSIEKRLKADEIEYVALPKNHQKDVYLSAKPKNFNDEEVLGAAKLKGQTINVNEGTNIVSSLNKSVQLSDKFDIAEINTFVKNNILYGDQYRFWKKKENEITYYQQYGDKVFYKNTSGELTLYLNDENNIVSYKQTYLENIEKLDEEKIIQPIKAIETLYDNGVLKPKSKITKVELGYFTFDHTSTSQVLTPAWRFEINGEENLFVQAFEGQIIQLNDEENKLVE